MSCQGTLTREEHSSSRSELMSSSFCPGFWRKYTCADDNSSTWNQTSSGNPKRISSSFSYLSFCKGKLGGTKLRRNVVFTVRAKRPAFIMSLVNWPKSLPPYKANSPLVAKRADDGKERRRQLCLMKAEQRMATRGGLGLFLMIKTSLYHKILTTALEKKHRAGPVKPKIALRLECIYI